nr:dTDP-4-dehydrorhamnose reductase [Pseudomonas sp. s4]
MFKVLVTGAKGQVGSELIKLAPAGFTVIGLCSAQLDITDQSQVNATVALHQPHLIINAAAYTAVDKAESDSDNAYAVNEQGVAWLAQAAKQADIPFFHISTDYVFDGESTTPYKETDPVNPQSVYGMSKLAGEQVLAATHNKHIILRTSWVFGATGNNFVKTMLRLGKERDELSVVADQHGCPTSARSIAEVLWQLAEKYVTERALPWGIYHFSNSPACTWHEFAVEIFQQAKECGLLENIPSVKSITSEDYPTPAKRPAWSVLDCNKIEFLLGKKVALWESELLSALD